MKYKILAVDDEPINRSILEDFIEEQYQLALVDSGQACIDFLESEIPDMILLDVYMPDMDGFEVCQTIKQDARFQQIPIVFLTAKAEEQAIQKGMALGAVDYITKPFSEEQLFTVLQTVLGD